MGGYDRGDYCRNLSVCEDLFTGILMLVCMAFETLVLDTLLCFLFAGVPFFLFLGRCFFSR